jgi:hypothetical protein
VWKEGDHRDWDSIKNWAEDLKVLFDSTNELVKNYAGRHHNKLDNYLPALRNQQGRNHAGGFLPDLL